jgi:hypothetical protein
MLQKKTVTIDDLQSLRADVLRRNPPARADTILARKLFRKELQEHGAPWIDAALDRCFDSLTLRERRDEQPTRPTRFEPPTPTPTTPTARPTPAKPSPEQIQAARDTGKARGNQKFERALAAVRSMSFANGKGILDQTVSDIQSLGSWTIGILRILPKSAAPTDRIGKYLTLEEVTKIRTFDV